MTENATVIVFFSSHAVVFVAITGLWLYVWAMRFHEKLRRRVDELGLNKAKAAREVGLPESTISNYLASDESLPRVDIAAKISKAIRVPLEWLADDAADWPPPQQLQPKPALEDCSPHDLKVEIAKRHRREVIRILDALALAERMIAKKSYDIPPAEARRLLFDLNRVDTLTDFSPDAFANENHAMMPGHERPVDDFYGQVIAGRMARVGEDPGIREAKKKALAMLPPDQIPNPMSGEVFTLLTELANGKAEPLGPFVSSVQLGYAELGQLKERLKSNLPASKLVPSKPR